MACYLDGTLEVLICVKRKPARAVAALNKVRTCGVDIPV